MKELQLKSHIEASEATKQLEDARKRAAEAAINAADAISKVDKNWWGKWYLLELLEKIYKDIGDRFLF